MALLILPGFSLANKDWAEEAQKNLGGEVWSWQHWTGEKQANWQEVEAEKILAKIGDQKINLLAKSIGTAVAMRVYAKIPNQIEKIVFCGIPMNDFLPGDENLYKPMSEIKDIIVFQNDADPHGNFDQAERFVHAINHKIKIVQKSAPTHDYPYFEDFQNFYSRS